MLPLHFFRLLWASAHLFHYEFGALITNQEFGPVNTLALLCIFSALLCLIFSCPRYFFVPMMIFQIFESVSLMPVNPNHWTLVSIVNISLLLSETKFYDPEEQFRYLSAIWRPALATFYFFAFFWKLNYDFVNPELSCATQFLAHVTNLFSTAPVNGLIAPLVLLAELALPILLLMPKQRNRAVMLGVIFHLALAIDKQKVFLNFSSVMMALWFLVSDPADQFRIGRASQILGMLFALLLLGTALSTEPIWSWYEGRHVLWFFYSTFFAVLIFQSNIFGKTIRTPLRTPLPATIFFTALIFLIGFAPIIGIRTGSAWQMYSNLMLNDRSSNHILLVKSFDLWGYMKEELQIISSKDPYLDAIKKNNQILTKFELGRYCYNKPCLGTVVISTSGERISLNDAVKTYNNLPFWKKKLFRFLPIDTSGKTCAW